MQVGVVDTVHHPSKPTVIWPVKPVHHPVKPVCGCCGASSHGTGPNPAELHNPGTGIPIPLPLPGAVDPIDTHGPTGSHGSHHSNGVIRGTKGNDNLHGTEKADRIKAKGGNDVIYTGAG
ncbi:MAG: hypothetical protein KAG56_02650, partial [Sulfurovaceae bacterium]|nr:hypothetical protein [Sulfurovaceae bacterium]